MLLNEYGELFNFEQYGGFNSLLDISGVSIIRDIMGNIITFDNFGKITIPPIKKPSKYWSKGIYFNYLTGQFETCQDVISELCFYDIEIN